MKKTISLVLAAILCISMLAGCSCRHVWRDATCVTPVFCEKCGETQGETAAHKWIEATCIAPKTCSTCGLTEGASLEHQWTPATCSAPQTCSLCGTIQGEAVAHQWVDATCLTAKTCSVCNAVDGEPLGHDCVKWTTVTAATCQESGLSSGTCTRCQNTLEKTIQKTDHTPGDWEINKPATVTENGQRAKKCTACGEILTTEEYELTDKEQEELYKSSCESYTFQEIARAPDQYKGKLAKFTGEVIQVQQDSLLGILFYTLRVNVTKTGEYYTYYTDTIYVTYTATADDPRILEDDIITMYGVLEGEETYTTIFGASVTIPSFSAEYIDIQ